MPINAMQIENPKSEIEDGFWLPDLDLNQDKQIQSLLCYRYTIGQPVAWCSVALLRGQSRRVKRLNRYRVAFGRSLPPITHLTMQPITLLPPQPANAPIPAA